MATTDGTTGGTQRSREGRTQPERRAASERRLLNATARLLAERGTSSVSFADIAREAGCSHGLPGYLFGSKNNLLLALVDDLMELFRQTTIQPILAAHGGTNGLDVVLEVMRVFLESLEDPWPHTRALYVLIGESQGAPAELHSALAAHHEAARAVVRQSLAAGIERGEVRADVEPDAQAVVLMGMLRGIGLQVLMDPKAIDVKAVTAEVLSSTRRALAAEGS